MPAVKLWGFRERHITILLPLQPEATLKLT